MRIKLCCGEFKTRLDMTKIVENPTKEPEQGFYLKFESATENFGNDSFDPEFDKMIYCYKCGEKL